MEKGLKTIRRYINKIEKIITLKIKTGYYLECFNSEKIKLP